MPFENLTALARPPVQAPVATQDLHVVELPGSRRADQLCGTQNLNAGYKLAETLGSCVELPGDSAALLLFQEDGECVYCIVGSSRMSPTRKGDRFTSVVIEGHGGVRAFYVPFDPGAVWGSEQVTWTHSLFDGEKRKGYPARIRIGDYAFDGSSTGSSPTLS